MSTTVRTSIYTSNNGYDYDDNEEKNNNILPFTLMMFRYSLFLLSTLSLSLLGQKCHIVLL